MHFEQLPNEIIAEIFSFLLGNDCVLAFSCLNQRFQCLIEEYSRGFNFQFVNKTQFDWFFEQYDKNWWKSLKLSNEYIFGQIEYFFQCYSLVDDRSQLQSLSLLQLEHVDQFHLSYQLSFLTNLVSLTIKPFCGQILSSIDLPNLKRLAISSCRNTQFLESFSQLEIVDYEFDNCCSNTINFIWPKQLKHLKIIYTTDQDSQSAILASLKDLSQLRTLEIYQKQLGHTNPNGQIWKDMISSSLVNLNKFQFYFPFYYSTKSIASILSTFDMSKAQCDIYESTEKAVIYSIPCSFDQYHLFDDFYQGKIQSISNSNKHLKTLIIESMPERSIICESTPWLANRFKKMKLNFPSIEQIIFSSNCYYYPHERYREAFSMNFLTLIQSSMSRLHSLKLRMNDLRILTNDFTNHLLCEYLSTKIHSLKIYENDRFQLENYLNNEEVNQLIKLFGRNCSNLSIDLLVSIDRLIHLLTNFEQIQCLNINMQTNDHFKLTTKWLDNQRIRFNSSNCYIFNNQNRYFFFFSCSVDI